MKATYISLLVALIFVGGAILVTKNNDSVSTGDQGNNVSIVNDKQIIEIRARGGYSPKVTTAKANIPTVIRMETKGTFDCSSALVIPSLNYKKNLPSSGITEIEIPAQKVGSTIQGLCSMGMYNFEVNFI